MADWVLYLLGGLMIALIAAGIWVNPWLIGIGAAVGYFAWTIPAAIALRKWRLLVLTPLFFIVDWMYRAVFIHAIVRRFANRLSNRAPGSHRPATPQPRRRRPHHLRRRTALHG